MKHNRQLHVQAFFVSLPNTYYYGSTWPQGRYHTARDEAIARWLWDTVDGGPIVIDPLASATIP